MMGSSFSIFYKAKSATAWRQAHHMHPGDSLYFDSDVPHGPEQLIKLPIRFLSIITYARDND